MNIKNIYLTIDDSPSCDMKMKIDFLFHNSITAIWFCQGNGMEKMPEEIMYAIKKGFIIGNHSYSHPKFSALSLDEATEQIYRTDTIIEDLYQRAGIQRPAKLFRFPIGDNGKKAGCEHAKAIQKYLKDSGYNQLDFKKNNLDPQYNGTSHDVDIFWDFDSKEYRFFLGNEKYKKWNKQKIIERLDNYFNKPSDRNKIMLVHDHHETTDLFVQIIEHLIKKGVSFIMPYLT